LGGGGVEGAGCTGQTVAVEQKTPKYGEEGTPVGSLRRGRSKHHQGGGGREEKKEFRWVAV